MTKLKGIIKVIIGIVLILITIRTLPISDAFQPIMLYRFTTEVLLPILIIGYAILIISDGVSSIITKCEE